MKQTTLLKRKFVAYFFIGLLFSLIITTLYVNYSVAPDILRNEETQKIAIQKSIADNTEVFVNQQILITQNIGELVFEAKNENEIKQNIDKKINSLIDLEGIIVLNQNKLSYGNLSLKYDETTNKMGDKTKASIIESNSKGPYNEVYIAIPGTVNNSKGYVVSKIKNTSLDKVLSLKNESATSILYGATGKAIGADSKGPEVTEGDILSINSKYQTLSEPTIEQNNKMAIVSSIPSLGWNLISIENKSDFYNNGTKTIYKVFGIVVLLALILIIFILSIGHALISPLAKLLNWMTAVQNNDLNFKTKIKSNSMFSEVADVFEEMVQKLRDNYSELQKQAEELYERNWQVEEANKELEDSYQRLQETINQLNEAEEKYYALVKNIPEIVCVIELDGTITFANDVIVDILGYHKGELIGKSIDTIIDSKTTKKFLAIMNKKLKRQNRIIIELPMRRKDGKEIIAEAKLTYHLREGNIDGVQAIVRDITKQKKLQTEIMHRNEELLTIYNISKSLSSTIELDNVFKLIVSEVCKILGADLCILRILDGSGKQLILRASSGTYLNEISEEELNQFINLPVEKVSQAIYSKQIVQMENLDPSWSVFNFNTKKPASERINQITLVPICAKDRVLGMISIGTKGRVNEKRFGIMTSIANNAAVAIENATLYENSKKYFIKTIDALIAAVEAKDKYTEGHSRRVSKYVEVIGNALGLEKEKIDDLKVAGILHDVGKIGISDNILLKPGKLTDEEYEEVKQHPIISNRILYSVGLSEITMKAIACHHERYDGRGYPFGLKEDELDIECQIIAVADSLDAMTSNRAYRRALSFDEAINEIVRNRGLQFGPIVVDALLEMYNNDIDIIAAISRDTEIAG